MLVGFGCIGQGVLALLLRPIEMRPDQVLGVTPSAASAAAARAQGVACLQARLAPDNSRDVLAARLASGDFVLNVSVDVSTSR